jgi:hypothetical protein
MPELSALASFLGLDPGSFGDVDNDVADHTLPGATRVTNRPRPDDRLQRIAEFLGIEIPPAAPRRSEPPRRQPEPRVEEPPAPARAWRRADDDILPSGAPR